LQQSFEHSTEFDAVIDFEVALRDPDHRTHICRIMTVVITCTRADPGHLRMRDAIELSLFDT
jgi:hypothetical protein